MDQKKMMKRAAFWAQHVEAWKKSGLSRRAYCQRESLKVRSFDYWRSKLKAKSVSEGENQGRLRLVPLTNPEKKQTKTSIKLEFKDCVLIVDDLVAPDLLKLVITTLRQA